MGSRGSSTSLNDDNPNSAFWSFQFKSSYTYNRKIKSEFFIWQITNADRTYLPLSYLSISLPGAVSMSRNSELSPFVKYFLPVNEDKRRYGYEGSAGIGIDSSFKLFKGVVEINETLAGNKYFYADTVNDEGEALADYELELNSALTISLLSNLKLKLSMLYGQEFDLEGEPKAYLNHIEEIELTLNSILSVGIGHHFGLPDSNYIETEQRRVINPPFASENDSQVYLYIKASL